MRYNVPDPDYIKLGDGLEKGGIRIHVEDTGIGIPEESYDKVFT